jgi:WD40 repeat protein
VRLGLLLLAAAGARLTAQGGPVRLAPPQGHQGSVTAVAVSPDERFAASAGDHDDRTVRLWEIETGRLLFTLRGHTDGITSVEFAPTGRHLLTASDDSTARLWDLTELREIKVYHASSGLRWARFSGDGRLVLAADRQRALLWETASGRSIDLLVPGPPARAPLPSRLTESRFC